MHQGYSTETVLQVLENGSFIYSFHKNLVDYISHLESERPDANDTYVKVTIFNVKLRVDPYFSILPHYHSLMKRTFAMLLHVKVEYELPTFILMV